MLEFVNKMCHEKNVKLLYLTKFGSHLYGTNTPDSDVDYKGIFLPSKEQCILQDVPKTITFSTGKNNSKNNKDDIDIQLFSLQYFFKKLSTGEVNALDLFFSHSYSEVIEYIDNKMNFLFMNYDRLFKIEDCNAFCGYAYGQAKKHGISGTRLGKIKNVLKYIENNNFDSEQKLITIIDEIEQNNYDKSFCFKKSMNGNVYLVLCGKLHQGTITIDEFHRRVKLHYDDYGDRVKLAEKNQGIDYKSLSHAVRSLIQMDELIETGFIQFPLKNVDLIKQIKLGELHFNEIEEIINTGINSVKQKLKTRTFTHKKDQKFINNFILSFY